jgi:hypothetical protein
MSGVSQLNIMSDMFPSPNYRLKIEDDETMGRDQLAAWACIRLDRLQQGYRLINLIDAEGVETDGLLLVKIEKSLR